MANKEYFYPVWLRLWHWLNAVLFLCLIISGISLQYSGTTSFLIPFPVAIQMHNVCGIMLTLSYLLFVVGNFITGNYKQYIPPMKGLVPRLIKQARYYSYGIFKNEPHPFETSKDNKFNPLQQISYLKIMYVLMPLIIITGFGLLFPDILLDEFFGESGLFYTALLHTITGFILSVFMVGHIYLGTTGSTVSDNFKAMMTGWHEKH